MTTLSFINPSKAAYEHEIIRSCMKSADINKCIKNYGVKKKSNKKQINELKKTKSLTGPIELEVIPYKKSYRN